MNLQPRILERRLTGLANQHLSARPDLFTIICTTRPYTNGTSHVLKSN
jgi:hypothetical protein